MVNPKEKIIIVVDNYTERRDGIRKILTREGFIVSCANTIKIAEEHCIKYSPDLLFIITSLDINSSFIFCKRFKKFQPSCKILFSSSIKMSGIEMLCFQNGIDDYIKNPTEEGELIARIKKSLSLIDNDSYIEYHGIKLHTDRQEVILNNVHVYISRKETKLLEYIINAIVNHNYKNETSINTLSHLLNSNEKATRMCINRLKKKFYENTGMKIIKCRYGVGYYISI